MRRIEDQHWWFVSRREIVSEVLARNRPPGPCRILDVGCGTGGNFQMLSAFGDVTGVEMNASACRSAFERGARKVYQGSFPEALTSQDTPFNMVTFLDVLEHLDHDLAALEAARRLLAQGGLVLITVPAFQFLWSSHDARHHHHRRYTATQLRELLRQAGLEPVYVSYFNMWLFPLIAAIRFGKKWVGNVHSDDEHITTNIVNKILKAIFASERHLLGRISLPFGVSLLAIAKKAGP